MATITVIFGSAVTKGEQGSAPVMNAYPRASEDVTSSGTTAQSTITALRNDVCEISNPAGGADIRVAFGADPTAAAGTGHIVPTGQTRWYGGMIDGHKVAVIDV